MRIVGGRFRGGRLDAPRGMDVRPTTDRVRESVFNMLQHGDLLARGLDGVRVLDLFAGTGAMGLEALSRGARYALFVEEAVPARAAIRRNIEALGLTGASKVYRRDATRLGPRPGSAGAPFDLVFCDPPYGKDLGPRALASARDHDWLAPHAVAVLETGAREEVPAIEGFTLADRRDYSDTTIWNLRLA